MNRLYRKENYMEITEIKSTITKLKVQSQKVQSLNCLKTAILI